MEKFSKREMEVLSLLPTGATNQELADFLFVSPRTIESHIKSMCQKSGKRNRVQLITAYLLNGEFTDWVERKMKYGDCELKLEMIG